MDTVAKKDPEFFTDMQLFAKQCADQGVLRVVFVFSDSEALPLLLSSTAILRAEEVYEVGDLTDGEAEAWLVKEYLVEPSRAAELVATLCGGLFPLLHRCGKSKEPVKDIAEALFEETRFKLTQIGVKADHKVLRAILARGRITMTQAHRLATPLEIKELLRKNIVAVHVDNTLTFHDRRVVTYVRGEVAKADAAAQGGAAEASDE